MLGITALFCIGLVPGHNILLRFKRQCLLAQEFSCTCLFGGFLFEHLYYLEHSDAFPSLFKSCASHIYPRHSLFPGQKSTLYNKQRCNKQYNAAPTPWQSSTATAPTATPPTENNAASSDARPKRLAKRKRENESNAKSLESMIHSSNLDAWHSSSLPW